MVSPGKKIFMNTSDDDYWVKGSFQVASDRFAEVWYFGGFSEPPMSLELSRNHSIMREEGMLSEDTFDSLQLIL